MGNVGTEGPTHHAVPALLVVSVKDPAYGISDGRVHVAGGDGEGEGLSSGLDRILAPVFAHVLGEDDRGRKFVLGLAFRVLHDTTMNRGDDDDLGGGDPLNCGFSG